MSSKNVLALAAVVLLTSSCDVLSALGVTDCTGATPYTIGSTISGTVGSDDCKDPEGNIGDPYQFTLTSQTTVQFTVTGGHEIIMYAGALSAAQRPTEVGTGDNNPAFFLPAGSYTMIVGEKGDYTIKTSNTAVTGCPAEYIIMPGVTVSGTVTAASCAGNAPARQDIYAFQMTAGQSISVNGSTNKAKSAIALYTGIANPTELVVRKFDAAQGGSGQFSYTATSAGEYRVHVFCEPATVGSCGYTFSLQ